MSDDDAIPWEARFRRERAARLEAEGLDHTLHQATTLAIGLNH